jgi:hypothetical protein
MFSMERNDDFVTMREASTPEGRLHHFCNVLNQCKDAEKAQALLAWIEKWKAARSMTALLHENPDLGIELHHASSHPNFVPSSKRKYGYYQVVPNHPSSDKDFAIWMFAQLVTNPLCEKLTGPCARCGKFFIKKRATQTVYCSRRCGNAATAVARTRERIEKERQEKIRRVKAAIRDWRPGDGDDWKRWVAKRADVDLRFVTRAVKRENLDVQKGKP